MPQMVFRRHEIKYQLNDEQRARLERLMADHMRPDDYGPSTVRNLYYDTPTMLLARRSAEHPFYKEKIRIRSYTEAGPDDLVFLELKKKCDGVVYKRRCTLPLAQAQQLLEGTREPQTQIEREIAFAAARYEGLAPVMYVAYDREAYYAVDDREFRMTFDRRVRFRTEDVVLDRGSDGRTIIDSTLSVLEVKCALGMPLWLSEFLSCEGLFKARFSKYGTAVSMLYAERADRRHATALHPRRARHAAPIAVLNRSSQSAGIAAMGPTSRSLKVGKAIPSHA